ncbi:MAG: ABC-F family ATP-binding cassette domain-containing protein [Clostridia bacterium]|nr:ABC-F family ATP-binding cassette domain-containing protein [Clostridia bacterium]
MISVSCDNIHLSFGVEKILDGISFALNEGDRLGIVGVNGAGKSSLLKIIMGEYDSTEGSVYISKEKTIGMLSQNAVLSSERTVYEEMLDAYSSIIKTENEIAALQSRIENGDESVISAFTSLNDRFAAMGGYEYKSRAMSFLTKLGFSSEDIQKPVNTLSGGQKTRLALGKLILNPPDILLLDEPTNHLDTQTLFWLEEILAPLSSTVITVSHDRYFLDKVCTKILDIEYGKGKIYKGNYTSFVDSKEKDKEIQRRHYENQQRQIAHMEAFIEQQKRWNREKNIIAAESRQKAIDRMVKLDAPDKAPDAVRMTFDSGSESGQDILTVKKLSKSYGEKRLFGDVSFLIKKGDFAFITGKNGCGKSTLLKILNGRSYPDGGTYEFGYNVRIGYYDQENQQLHDEKTVIDELWDEFPDASQTKIRSLLALFLFKGDDIKKQVCNLSGGEKARLTMAKLMMRKNNVLLLDEPTNHLDIPTREVLEQALVGFGGTVIAVSHDRYFISKLASRILDIEKQPLLDHKGSYDSYISYLSRFSNDNGSTAERSPSMTDRKAKYFENKKNQAEKRRLENLIKKTRALADTLEAQLEELEEQISECGSDYVRLMELDRKKTEAEEQLLSAYETVEEAEIKLSEF